jgi:hypothetical protein
MDPPVSFNGLSPVETKCLAWLCEYAHVAGPVRGAIRRAGYGTIRLLLHRASVAAGFANSTAGFLQNVPRLAPTYLLAIREVHDNYTMLAHGELDVIAAALYMGA